MFFNRFHNFVPEDDDGECRGPSPFTQYDTWIKFDSLDDFIRDLSTVFDGKEDKSPSMRHEPDKSLYHFYASYEDGSNWCEGSSEIANLDYDVAAKAAKFKTVPRLELGGNLPPSFDFYSETDIEEAFASAVDKYGLND